MDKVGIAGLGLFLAAIVIVVVAALLVYWSWRGLVKGFVTMVMEPKCY